MAMLMQFVQFIAGVTSDVGYWAKF